MPTTPSRTSLNASTPSSAALSIASVLYLIPRRPERFPALVRAIIFQQLAGRAAQTIHDRFVKAIGARRFPTPALVLAASDETLRTAGLSRGKMAYVRDLAAHVRDRKLDFHRFSAMDDDAIIADLTKVRGIGRWTAEMYLMFNLHRPDVLPVDDLGVRQRRRPPLRDGHAATAPATARIRRTLAPLSLGRRMVPVAEHEPGHARRLHQIAPHPNPRTAAKPKPGGKPQSGKKTAIKPANRRPARSITASASRAKPGTTRKPRKTS